MATALIAQQLAACYHYVPATTPEVPIGSRVAVSITDPGRLALAEPVGPGVRRLEGQLLARTDTSIAVSVTTVDFFDVGVPVVMTGQRIELARDHVAEIRQYRISRTRSWLMAGLLAVGVAAVSLIAITGLGGGDGGDRPGGPDNGTQQ